MPKFTGKLCFDVEIEEQETREAVDKIAGDILASINKVRGIDIAELVDEDIEKEDDEEGDE